MKRKTAVKVFKNHSLLIFEKKDGLIRDIIHYIRPEYHERLLRIIQIIADDQISLYAYLDNILAYHFEMFEKEITDDFNKKYRPIF